MSNYVNVYDLAAAALASTISASIPIRNIASVNESRKSVAKKIDHSGTEYSSKKNVVEKNQESLSRAKNADSSILASLNSLGISPTIAGVGKKQSIKMDSRKKTDGTLVTVADGAAQQIIVDALLNVSKHISIVGEESYEDERGNASDDLIQNKNGMYDHKLDCTYEEIYEMAQSEIHQRRGLSEEDTDRNLQSPNYEKILCSRVSVYIDPLDGTTSFAKGKYDAVSILVAIIMDNSPIFGVICKPFGKEGKPSVHNSGCFACYGGNILKGAYIAGGEPCTIIKPQIKLEENNNSQSPKAKLPRAVISKSRAGGVVGKCLDALNNYGLLDKDPVLVDGAGEKSLRLIVGTENEALWFFPKPGTSLWDVAALDAILISVGGKLTDKYGKRLDYTKKNRLNACNNDGIVASIDTRIHETCIRIYGENKWSLED